MTTPRPQAKQGPKGSEPAFPGPSAVVCYPKELKDNPDIQQIKIHCNGLSKREYFAAMAMQGVLVKGYGANREERVKEAVTYADLLLAQLSNPEPTDGGEG